MSRDAIKQLEKLKNVKLDLSNIGTTIRIAKTSVINPANLRSDKVYDILFSDSFICNKQFAKEWNSGKLPVHNRYTAEVVDSSGLWVKLNGVAKDDSLDNWYGWVPINDMTILNVLS